MKVLCTALLFLFFSFSLSSQTTLWGTVENGGLYGNGYIYRTDSIGNNLVIAHHFNGADDGKSPGALMQASNGKLYGMTAGGGHGSVFLMNHPSLGPLYTMGGTLYEYDPVIDSFRVLIHFNSTDPQYPAGFDGPSSMKILEVSPGNLWCVFNLKLNNNGVTQALPRYIAAYNTATQALTPVVSVPSWYTPSESSPQLTSLSGELYKAPNGMVYGTTEGYSSCATLSPISIGSVISIDPVSHAFSWISPFVCSGTNGRIPRGQLEPAGGKLYSYAYWGGMYTMYPANGYGTIFEYDPVTNANATAYHFPGGTNGQWPLGRQLLANNGKLYGTTQGGTPVQNFPNGSGMIYEFDPATGIYAKKADFVHGYTIADMGSLGSIWLKSSGNGKLYGTTQKGIFEYNTHSNQIRIAARFNAPLGNSLANEMKEICRMPAYKPLSINSYTVCAGASFTLDLRCYNASSVVWKHNGIPDASYTSPLLSFNQIGPADAGSWVCEMTNACGTSTAQSISITVNPSGTGALTSTITASGSTSICPGSTITLSGNVNGVWNTGAVAPSIQVSLPGTYQVINTNACGNTFSNMIRIDTIATPAVPVITFTTSGTYNAPILTQSACPGDSALLLGNYPGGVWSSGETAPFIYVKDVNPRYITVNNGCLTVLSATAQLAFIAVQIPSVTAIGSLTICAGDSTLLAASGGSNTGYNWYNDNGITNSYVGYGNQYYARQSGNYYIRQNPYCGPVYSQTIHIDASGTAVGPALITPLSSTVICQGDGVVLQSNYASCTWNTGATTQTILATGTGPYTVTNYNSCSSSTSAPMSISVTPVPAVHYTEANNAVCFTTGAFTLTPGNPAGGYYTGSGVSASTFDPVLAGAGTHTVTYNYTDPGTGCTGKAVQPIAVEGDPVLTAAPSTLICQGSSTVLFQDSPTGVWNSTGQPGLFIVVTQPGTYYVSKTNGCGVPVTSNTLQVVSKPSPTISVSGNNAICTGQSVTLSANGGTSYTWTPGGISNLLTVSPTANTSYTLTGAGSNGCFGYTIETVTVYALPSIVTTNTSVCLGSQAVLSAGGAATYTWSTSQTGSSIAVTPTLNTVYQVTGADSHSCVSTSTVSVTVNPLPPVPVIALTGNILSSSPAAGYQWYLNGGIIAGATSQTYAPVQNGNYTVVVYDQNGCSASSALYPIVDTGLSGRPAGSGAMEVYPNPSTGSFTVQAPFSEYEVRITDALGRIVAQKTGSFTAEFSIGENGIYLIHLMAKGHVYTKKLVVSAY